MSIVDIVLACFMLAGAYGGYRDGFVLSLFSLVAIILGVLGGFKLMGIAMVFLNQHYKIESAILPYVAFAMVFVIIAVCVSLLGRIVKSAIQKSLLGVVDQAAGALFGIVRIAFMLSVMLWILDSLRLKIPEEFLANSRLLPAIANFGVLISKWVGSVLPFLGDALSTSGD